MGHDAEHGAVAQHTTSAQLQLGGIRKTHTALKTDRTSLSWPYSRLCNLHHSLEYECRLPTLLSLSSLPCVALRIRCFLFLFLFLPFTLSDTPPGNASSLCRGNFLVFCFLFGDIHFFFFFFNWRDEPFFSSLFCIQLCTLPFVFFI